MLSKQETIEVAKERYYVDGKPTSKEEYLDQGGMPVPRPIPVTEDPLIPPGIRALELFDNGTEVKYYIKGALVSREAWLQAAQLHAFCDISREAVRSEERKAFANIKNYLHNTLGLTKTHVQGMLKNMLQDTLLNLVRQELGLCSPSLQYGGAETSQPFTGAVRKIVIEELQKMARMPGGLDTYIETLCHEEIRRHVLAHLKVDIRVQSVNPPDSVEREMLTPDYSEVREI